MSVNKHAPHVLVLPEDRANSQLANGFLRDLDGIVLRKVQVLPEAGGWGEVLNHFESDLVAGMDHNSNRFVVLLIDFDEKTDRLNYAKGRVPDRLKERVFILGAFKTPEDLKRAGLGAFEEIGIALAQDCRKDTATVWDHRFLRHNAGELARLREHVRPILFPSL